MIKTKKQKKSVKQRGKNSYGHGSRKKWKGKGHRGGKGMSGTGKKADQKKTLILKKYKKYFGKQGITSKRTFKKKDKVINLRDIQENFDSLMKKFGKENKLNLKDYKILGDGEIKKPITIIAKSFTKTAKEKIEKINGKIFENIKDEDKEIKKEEILKIKKSK